MRGFGVTKALFPDGLLETKIPTRISQESYRVWSVKPWLCVPYASDIQPMVCGHDAWDWDQPSPDSDKLHLCSCPLLKPQLAHLDQSICGPKKKNWTLVMKWPNQAL